MSVSTFIGRGDSLAALRDSEFSRTDGAAAMASASTISLSNSRDWVLTAVRIAVAIAWRRGC
jgi:hypothetical protein